MVGCLHFTAQISHLIQGQTICDLARYFIFYSIPSIFHLPFSLKCISFCPNHISQHQLDCAYTFIIISPLSVPFVVGLVQCFNVSLLEAFLYLFNIGRDLPRACICTYCREKVNRKSRSFPKHEIMGWISHNC